MTRRPMHETRPKEAGRLIGWTPETIANYIRDFAGEVTAELDRLEREMKALEPTCSTYRHQYTTAANLTTYSNLLTTTKTATVLGFAQMRTVSGAISSACVWADWETGEVSVTGWRASGASGA